MPRTPRPLDRERAAIALVTLIERRAGKACPTLADIAGYTAIPERRIWRFVEELRARGLIDVEVRGAHVQRQRRMRVFCGDWTGWTVRRRREHPDEEPA